MNILKYSCYLLLIFIVVIIVVPSFLMAYDNANLNKNINDLSKKLAQCQAENDALNNLLDYYETKSMEEFYEY